MSKKDYIAMADELRSDYLRAKAHLDSFQGATRGNDFARAQAKVEAWNEACDCIANAFAADNPAFKRSLWFAYLRGECGPNGGAVQPQRITA